MPRDDVLRTGSDDLPARNETGAAETAATEPLTSASAPTAEPSPEPAQASYAAPPPAAGESTVAAEPVSRDGWRARARRSWDAGRRRKWLLPVAAAVVLLGIGGVAGGAIGFADGLGHGDDRHGQSREAGHVERGDRGAGDDRSSRDGDGR